MRPPPQIIKYRCSRQQEHDGTKAFGGCSRRSGGSLIAKEMSRLSPGRAPNGGALSALFIFARNTSPQLPTLAGESFPIADRLPQPVDGDRVCWGLRAPELPALHAPTKPVKPSTTLTATRYSPPFTITHP
ncbi:hypothetical protein PAPYR_1886 [Paratrimastix pyriformis]|uniref:Uncharacterized protein n=1 Tax=Paratrimastix pyriformis TaxID=342808 RepID=A0ABQ8UWM4_9EUKA|nr:hypothetical protein PAPYR_1886 [Paratrimastix pyriformis]